jgi:hypothetical protein
MWHLNTRREPYLDRAVQFKNFAENGVARDIAWKEEYGGVLQNEYEELTDWLKNNVQSMWD